MMDRTQLSRLGLFDARVPRYTSYPTAPQFGGGVDAGRLVRWIEAIPEGGQISLYLHIPFCRRLCWFCACRTQGTATASPVAAYLETLKAELALLRRHLPRGVTLSRMHWGGGTPTLLTPEMIRDLAGAVQEVAAFAPGAEFSVEIDPNEIDRARAEALRAAGMTRASIGVQDFDPEVQGAIGRSQSFEVTHRAVEMVRDAGIASLNADILYGLPHQSRARITETVQKLLSFAPDRVALYGYAHVPWVARRQQMIPTEALPGPEARLDLDETARRLFLWDGYRQIGIDHFARPGDGLEIAQRTGKLRRNFQGYTDDTAPVLVGLGASAISRFPLGYAQNAPATSAYVAAVRAGKFPVTRGHVFAGEDRMRARLIEAVMCDLRIDAAEILSAFDVTETELFALFRSAAAAFEGKLLVSDAGLAVPEEMRPLVRLIARHFDAYDLSRAGHSAAI